MNDGQVLRPSPTEAYLTHSHLCFPFEVIYIFCFKDFIYLFLERGEGRKRGKETPVCGCLSSTPYWGPGLQPRHVPWLGIEPVTLWFAGWCSIPWAPPGRAIYIFLLPSAVYPTFGGSVMKWMCFGGLPQALPRTHRFSEAPQGEKRVTQGTCGRSL